jgi:superoxide dismutase, Cu-Zn family
MKTKYIRRFSLITRKRFLINGLSALALVLAAVVAAISISGQAAARGGHKDKAEVQLRNADGQEIGEVTFKQERDGVNVEVSVHGLTPGFHGFHVHTVGSCVGPDFVSAGGHFNMAGHTHPMHSGDMVSLLVNPDGSGEVSFTTRSFNVADLFDADGSAVIVHAGPDNFANIPVRYALNGPDAMTLATGDSGGRTACGIVQRDN